MKINSAIYPVLLAVLLLSILFSCKKEVIKTAPTVSIAAVTSITANSASSGGDVTSDGGATVTTRGVCWSTSQSPTTSDSKTSNGSGLGSFTSSLTGLTPGVTYMLKAYATNAVGTSYSSPTSFATLALASTLTTSSLSGITATSAVCGGNISNDGGSAVTARGVCWSTNQNPSITDSKTNDGTGSGSFISSIAGLTPGTTYYVRAYATNNVSTAYGNQLTLMTLTTLPTLTTSTVSNITSISASSGGNITSDGGAPVTARGVCWSTSANPTIALSTKTTDGTGTGAFTSSLTGLTAITTYYVRAYATNSVGTAYGTQVSFATSAVEPTLTTTAASSITSTTATSGGNITSDGGASVTARGVCWSTSANPIIALSTKTIDGTGTGNFTSSLTSLSANTTYYVRAYATNSAGTAYGDEFNFKTILVLSLTTNAPINITYRSAELGGNITNEGASTVTERGICYSKSQNPTTDDNKFAIGSGTGNFSTSITDLITNTIYYVRSYAVNSQGTSYGNELSFTTKIVSIGNSYQGGIVAYILKSGDLGYISGQTQGIIAAPSDQGIGKWYDGSYTTIITTGATGLTIGTGNANTIAIVTQQGVGNYAAQVCYDLILNGYDDWYLPSRDELNALYDNRILIGGFGLTSLYTYWSSSELSNGMAWQQMFVNGLKGTVLKQSNYYFRAVRNF